MRVTVQEICKFACVQPNSKNFTAGENLINHGHILNCGLVNEDCSASYKILAFCLQTSDLKSAPYEINGEILNNGQIEAMECTCKAGLRSACKHIVAVLLYCNRSDLETLQIISCIDKKCVWDAPRKSVLQKYDMPLYTHECFNEKKMKSKIFTEKDEMLNIDENDDVAKYLMEEQEKSFRKLMVEENPFSLLAMHL